MRATLAVVSLLVLAAFAGTASADSSEPCPDPIVDPIGYACWSGSCPDVEPLPMVPRDDHETCEPIQDPVHFARCCVSGATC